MSYTSICFSFSGVIKKAWKDDPVEHVFPMLYRQTYKYDNISIYSFSYDKKTIKEWISHHDAEWRECCNRMIRDSKEDLDEQHIAHLTLNKGPIVDLIHYPKTRPKANVYVTSTEKGIILVTREMSTEVFETW